jgi:hypothetical protein
MVEGGLLAEMIKPAGGHVALPGQRLAADMVADIGMLADRVMVERGLQQPALHTIGRLTQDVLTGIIESGQDVRCA